MGEFIFFALLIFLAFYFILLRPVIEQQKRRRRDISSLDVGDEVLTTGGFYATIRDIQTQDRGPLELTLEAAPGVMLRATADAVASVTRRASEQADMAPQTGKPETGKAETGKTETGKAGAP